MSLGYVLLHPSRVQLALNTSGNTSHFLHEISDIAFGGAGVATDLGPGFTEYVDSRIKGLQDFVGQFRSWVEPSGPLGFVVGLAEGRAGSLNFGELFNRLVDALDSIGAFKEQIRTFLHELVNALPEATSISFTLFLREQFDAITAILESPLKGGRQDRAAQRGFRAAVTLRQVFGPIFEQVLSGMVAFDLKAAILKFLDDLLDRIDFPEIGRFTGFLGEFQARFGGIIEAAAKLNASFSVSVSVGGGPSGMADETLSVDARELLAAPDKKGDLLWFFDLVTAGITWILTIWEFVRTRNWAGRPFDGILSILGIIWQTIHSVFRLFLSHKVNSSATRQESFGKWFVNWLFTDMGNFAINLTSRLIGSLHDAYAWSNWAQSFVVSMLKFYSNQVNSRVFYWTARSWKYFADRRGATGVTDQPPLTSTVWGIWGPWWFFSFFFGLFPAWEDFKLEGDFTDRTIGTLVTGPIVLGIISAYLILGLIQGDFYSAFTINMKPDPPSLILIGVLMFLGVLSVSIILADTDSDDIGGPTTAFAIVSALLGAAFVALVIVFLVGHTGAGNTVLMQFIVFVTGFLIAGFITYFLWWFYLDDGRDKTLAFDALDSSVPSPYLLPYRKDDSWICSQGIHGIFSHYREEDDPAAPFGKPTDNHYSYDFNEDEGEPHLASREGIVIDFRDDVPTGEPRATPGGGRVANRVALQHMEWKPGHDPGTDLERVLTIAKYLHQTQNGIHADVGQRIPQGHVLGDIDSTGRSAVNHIHFNVAEVQFGQERSYPAVFNDGSTKDFRVFPIITSWLQGGWHRDGKPISQAFYTSDNAEVPAFPNPLRIQTSSGGAVGHTHFIELDRRVFDPRTAPGDLTLTTIGTTPDAAAAPVADHAHQVTISQADLAKLFGMKNPDAFALTAVDGHTHGFGSIVRRRGSAPQPSINIANPPAGQLLATRPFPHKLLGDQLTLRINDRAVDYLAFGAHRPGLLADIALDRGLRTPATIRVDVTDYNLPGSADGTVLGTTNALTNLWTSVGASLSFLTVRAIPTIVIETRRRGRSASLQVTFGGGPPRLASGTGTFDDLSQVPRAALAAHINTILRNGWPAAPAGLTATVAGDRLSLAIGGAFVDFSASSSRLVQVMASMYDIDPASPTFRVLRSTGDMPLSSGRLVFGGATPWPLPISGTHAEVRIDTTHPAFAGGVALAATPLLVTILGRQQSVTFSAAAAAAADIARRISQSVEGVRAFADGTSVVVQTIAAGSSAALTLTKEPGFNAANTGSSVVNLGASPALTDTTAILPRTLEALINDARARVTPPYDVGAVNPRATIDGNKLVVEVDAGNTVAAAGVFFTGTAPLAFTAVPPTRIETQDLPATLNLTGGAWIDIGIGANVVGVPIDGESARIDLAVLDRMPVAADTLRFSVNGGPVQTVTFTGNENSIAEVADAISRVSDEIIVRLAPTLSIENARYGNPPHNMALRTSNGLAAAGFLRDPGVFVTQAFGVGEDQLNIFAPSAGATSSFVARRHEDGPTTEAFTVNEAPSGANLTFRLDATAGLQVIAIPTAVGAAAASPDPLGWPVAAAATISTAALPPTLDLGVQSREYVFETRDAGGNIFTRTMTQITSGPAIARAIATPIALPVPVTPATLNIRVTAPGPVERTYAVDLAGLATLDEIAQNLNSLTPDLKAWVVRARAPVTNPTSLPATTNLLHLETTGSGTGWSLRLDNLPLLFALGFGRTGMDLNAGTLTTAGTGTVANSRAVTHDEIRTALARAAAGAVNLFATRTLSVTDDGTNILLRSLNGPVTIETEPPSLRAVLNVTETPAQTTLAPGANLDTGNATVIVKVAGRTAAVAFLWGRQGSVRGNRTITGLPAADLTAMLNLLKTRAIILMVDGVASPLPVVPGATSTIEDAIEFLAGAAPQAWIGIRNGNAVFESRRQGQSANITVDFSNFVTGGTYPAGTVLGFELTQLTAFAIRSNGDGSVAFRDAIPVLGGGLSLVALLRTAATEAASPQSVYDVEADATAAPARIRLRTHVAAWTLNYTVAAAGPGVIAFLPNATDSPLLEAVYPAAQAIDAGVWTVTVNQNPPTRTVRALVAAQPARLPALQRPTSLAVLNGKGFTVTIGTVAKDVTFTANAATTLAQIAAQIEKDCEWLVRASVAGASIVIETFDTGSAKSITLSPPPAATPNAITGNAATGFTAPAALPLQVNGAGSVPAMDAVSATDFQTVLSRAYLLEVAAGADAVAYGQRPLNVQAYDAIAGPPSFLTITSNLTNSCRSSVERIGADLAPSLGLSRGLERSPAVRGSVALRAFAGTKRLKGTLHIQFNDNAGIQDIAAPVVVPVNFVEANYDARKVARQIQDVLLGQGIGAAGVFPDGTVVIETAVPGLAGCVRVPAPGTGTAGDDLLLAQELVDPARSFGRGWPGMGFGANVRGGVRSRRGLATAASTLTFVSGATTVSVPINPGQSLADVQRAIDSALAGTAAGRIGLCMAGDDETIYIEAGAAGLALTFTSLGATPPAPNTWPVLPPSKPGDTPELVEEPAVGFRLTSESRTVRYSRDRFGSSVEAEFEDAGWVRLPKGTNGMAIGALSFPSGIYWTAVRAQASRTRDYDATGDMIISGGVDPADASHFFVHRARYWMALSGGQPMRIVQRTGPEFLFEVMW